MANIFKTSYKYSNGDEKRTFQQFRHWSRNSWTGYFVLNDDNQFKCANTQKSNLFANNDIIDHFNEVSFYQFVVASKQFIDSNHLEPEILGGRRYIYCVDKDIYDKNYKQELREFNPSIVATSKIKNVDGKYEYEYPQHIRWFRSYRELVNHVESKMKGKNIFIIDDEPLFALRYFLRSIIIIKPDSLIAFETGVSLPFDAFSTFLDMRTFNKATYSVTHKAFIVETPEYFNDFIKFYKKPLSKQAKKNQETTTHNYDIITLTVKPKQCISYRHSTRYINKNIEQFNKDNVDSNGKLKWDLWDERFIFDETLGITIMYANNRYIMSWNEIFYSTSGFTNSHDKHTYISIDKKQFNDDFDATTQKALRDKYHIQILNKSLK
jgi:hypothetical protein